MDIPPVIAAALSRGAVIALSVSAGKDSQATERVLSGMREKHNWPGPFFAIHADIGQPFDWPWTLALCERNAKTLGHPLHIVRRSDGATLLDTIRQRAVTTAGTRPPFPSAACRYCTRAAKTDPINKFLRRVGDLVINVMGLRAEESRSRAKLPQVSVRREITAERLKDLLPEDALAAWRPGKERLALDWNPILDWTLDQVWDACGTSQAALDARRQWFELGCYEMAFTGWPASPTYIFGLNRHSCAICCMSRRAEIPLAGRFKPELLQAIAELEHLSGFAWQQGYPIANIHVRHQPIPPAAYYIQPMAG